MRKNIGFIKNIWKHIGVFDVHVWCNKKGNLAKVKVEMILRMIIILVKVITLFLNRTMSIHYFNVYNVEKNVIVSKPHENQLFFTINAKTSHLTSWICKWVGFPVDFSWTCTSTIWCF
jgi:hypothetical protein